MYADIGLLRKHLCFLGLLCKARFLLFIKLVGRIAGISGSLGFKKNSFTVDALLILHLGRLLFLSMCEARRLALLHRDLALLQCCIALPLGVLFFLFGLHS